MTLLFCIIASNLAALALMPALVSLVPMRSRPGRLSSQPASDAASPSIDFQIQQTRSAVRETIPSQRRLVEVSSIVHESADVVSVTLTSVDGSPLPDFRPGQHLIVERPSAAGTAAASRCYTLSSGPSQTSWRITVRRVSMPDDSQSVSAWIHRDLQVGDYLRVRGPRGSFTLDKADATKPVVMIAAGVGITPMASMLHDELRYQRSRPKWLFYQVRRWEAAPLIDEMVALIEQSSNARALIMASQAPAPEGCPTKRAILRQGKLDPSSMIKAIGTNDITVFLCGPESWMTELRARLVALGVADFQIHDEAFGSSDISLTQATTQPMDAPDCCVEKFEVAFEASAKPTEFRGGVPNLLAHAKASAIHIPASCRTGHCGTCAVKLLRGRVRYLREPQAELADGEILPCICVPASDIGIQA